MDEQKPQVLSVIGTSIRNARSYRDLSQEELGKLVGKSQQAISAIELGSKNISMMTFWKIIEVLGFYADIDIAPVESLS